MAFEVKMPQLGLTMEEGTVTKWVKQEGDTVKAGDVILEITTDKLTSEVESEHDGVLLKIVAQEGEDIPVKGLLAYIGEAGEQVGDAPAAKAEAPAAEAAAPVPAAAPAPAAQAAAEKAAPKKTALELMDGDEVVKLAGMRKVVSERMTKSAQEIPTVTQNVRIDVTELMAFRKKINNDLGVKYSLNDYVLKATAKALKNNKHILVSLDGDQIIKRAHVNIGMAVALEDGLIVPVIKDADKMSLGEISEAARDLAERARTNKLSMDEYKGSTFSISNLGMFGVETFNPIINQPDAGILGVCAVQDELVMDAEGNITKRQFMRISFTFDHRLIDGATAAKFELAIRDLMEHPMQILL